jgi:hypothetical protein
MAACPVCLCSWDADTVPHALGPCGHQMCLPCLARTLAEPLTDLSQRNGPSAAGYIRPAAAAAGDEPPGLLCPLCAATAQERRLAAREHWLRHVLPLLERQQGVAWRLRIPAARAAPAWGARWCDAQGRAVLSLERAAGATAVAVALGGGAVAAADGGSGGSGGGSSFALPQGLAARELEIDVAIQGTAFFVWRTRPEDWQPAQVEGRGEEPPPTPSTESGCFSVWALVAESRNWLWGSSSSSSSSGGGGSPSSAALTPTADPKLLLKGSLQQPLPPVVFRHLQLACTGGAAAAGAPAPPPALPRGWLSPEPLALAAALAAEWGRPLPPAALARAERGLEMLAIFHASLGREALGLPDSSGATAVLVTAGAGGAGGVDGAAPPPPPALLHLAASGGSNSNGGSGGGGGSGTSGSGSGSGSGGGSGGGSPESDDSPFTPALVAPLLCPNAACAILLQVDIPPSLSANRGLHLTCQGCSQALCGHCGLPWALASEAATATHAGLPCSQHAEAQALAALSGSEALGGEELGPLQGAVQRCPNPTCCFPFLRYRGHACHSVCCARCSLSFCYVCLATQSEKEEDWHKAACPSVCSDLCSCQPCPDCARGKACDHCSGAHAGSGCVPCAQLTPRHRSETPAEQAARLQRQAEAQAKHKLLHPRWPGPRRFRTDKPVVAVGRGGGRGGGGGAGSGSAAARQRLQNAGARKNPWLAAALSPHLAGAAAQAREGLQLLDAVFCELGLLAGGGLTPEGQEMARHYLVRNETTGAEGLLLGRVLEVCKSKGGSPSKAAALGGGGAAAAAAEAAAAAAEAAAAAAASDSQHPSFPGFPVGALVIVRPSVAHPKWGWPSIPRNAVATVISSNAQSTGVHFNGQFYSYSLSTPELILACEFVPLRASALPVGARVRLLESSGGHSDAEFFEAAREASALSVLAGAGAEGVVVAVGGGGAAAGWDLLLGAAGREGSASLDLGCAVEEALALLQRAGSSDEAQAAAAARPSALADAQPSRETASISSTATTVAAAAAAAAGAAVRREVGLSPHAPPADLFYSATAACERSGGGGGAGEARPTPPHLAASTLAPYFSLISACCASPPPSPHARHYALVLLRHLTALLQWPRAADPAAAGSAAAGGGGGAAAGAAGAAVASASEAEASSALEVRRASRRAGWLLELMSLQGVSALRAALLVGQVGEGGACGGDEAVSAAARALIAAAGSNAVAVGLVAGWSRQWELEAAPGRWVEGGGDDELESLRLSLEGLVPGPLSGREPPEGTIVVRGPSWKWGDQDSGSGNTGKVYRSPDGPGWVAVQWASGSRNSYRWDARLNIFDVRGHAPSSG